MLGCPKKPGHPSNATIAKAWTEKKACDVQCCAWSPQKARDDHARAVCASGNICDRYARPRKSPRTVEAVLNGASSTLSNNRRVQTKKPPAPTSIGLGETHTFKAPGVGRPPKKLCWLPAAALHQKADKSIMDIARPPPQRMTPQPGQTCHSKKILLASLPRQRLAIARYSKLDLFDKSGSPRPLTRRGVPKSRDAPAIVHLCMPDSSC